MVNKEPNKEQQLLLNNMCNLLDGVDISGMAVLNAPAGTGKTDTVKRLYRIAHKKVVFLAPTHKASSLFKKDGINCKTIHKFLSAERDFDEDGNQFFHFSIKNIPPVIKMLIVDEASMVTKDMFEKFQQLSKRLFILFVCDDCQLPPVKEDKSPVFSIENKYTFTKNYRSNKKNLEMLNTCRKSIKEGKNIRLKKSNKSLNDYIKIFNQKDDAIFLVYTNVRKNTVNDLIRKDRFKINLDDSIETYYVGEKLIFGGYRQVSEDITHYSSDEIIIKKLEKKMIFLEYKSCEHNKSEKGVDNCDECGISKRNMKGYDIPFYEIYDHNDTLWYIPMEKEKNKLKKLFKHYKDHIMVMIDNGGNRKSLWGEYYGYIETYNPDLDYSYCMTVHKSQGSEWENVFVDLKNLNFSRKYDTLFNNTDRLIYTAVSRVREELFLLNEY